MVVPAFQAAFCEQIDGAWQEVHRLTLSPSDAGECSQPRSMPRWLCVWRDDRPWLVAELLLGVDRHGGGDPEIFHAQEVVGSVAFVGYGRSVFRLDLARATAEVVMSCHDYFGALYLPTQLGAAMSDYVLATSESSVVRLDLRGGLVWSAEQVGLDGVVLRAICANELHGSGEWDPPGGWRDFAIDLESGAVLRRKEGRLDRG